MVSDLRKGSTTVVYCITSLVKNAHSPLMLHWLKNEIIPTRGLEKNDKARDFDLKQVAWKMGQVLISKLFNTVTT